MKSVKNNKGQKSNFTYLFNDEISESDMKILMEREKNSDFLSKEDFYQLLKNKKIISDK